MWVFELNSQPADPNLYGEDISKMRTGIMHFGQSTNWHVAESQLQFQ